MSRFLEMGKQKEKVEEKEVCVCVCSLIDFLLAFFHVKQFIVL
jgi:hypothetical protein